MAKTKVTGGYIADGAIASNHLHTTLNLSTKTLTIGATTVSGHLIPDTNITYDLGSSTYRFRDIYLDGTTINLGGTELKKNSDGDIEFKSGSSFKRLVVSELEFDDGTNRKKFKIDSGRIKSFDSSGASDTADKISLSSNTTDDLGEGSSNLYFTNERVDDRVNALLSAGTGITLSYDDANNTLTISGSAQYGDSDARSAISVSGNALSYNSSTGVITANYEESPSFTGNVTVSGTISSGAITITTAAVPLSFVESGHTGNGQYWRMPLDSGNLRFDVSLTGGASFTTYDEILKLNSDGSINIQSAQMFDSSGNINTTKTISSGAITSTGAIQGTSFSDGTISGITFIDEDSFATNSSIRVPTQQSVKAYVDAQVAGVVDSAPAALNTLNELAAALGDDANFSTTTSTALGNRLRVDTASQGLTGTQQANAITNLGITATKAELNYVDGVTSNIQTQLDGKQASGSYLTGNQTITLSGDVSGSGTTSIAVTIADDSHNHVISNVDGLQTALDGKLSTSGTAANSQLLDSLDSSQFLRSDANDTFTGTLTTGELIIFSSHPVHTTYSGIANTEAWTTTTQQYMIISAGTDTYINGDAVYIRGGNNSSGNELKVTTSGTTIGGNTVWHAGNDGAGSGLDADLLDGVSWGNVNTPINVSSGTSQPMSLTTSSSSPWHLALSRSDIGLTSRVFAHNSPYNSWYFEHNISIAGSTNWYASNDGSGSGLDADLLDGQHGSYYLDYNNLSNKPTIPTNNNQLTNGAGYQTSSGSVAQSSYVSGSAFATTGSPSSVLEYAQSSGITDTRLAPSSDWYNSIRMGHGNPYSYYSNTIAMQMTGTGAGKIRTQLISNNNPLGWRTVWDSSTDGSGSGLDADLLDGQQGSYYYAASNPSGYTTFANGSSEHITYVNRIHSSDGTSPDNFGYDNRYQTFNYGVSSGVTGPLISFGGLGSAYPMQLTGAYSGGGGTFKMRTRNGDTSSWNAWRTIWHDGNDGSGSGLDADLLDGIQASGFVNQNGTYTLASGFSVAQGDWGIRNTTPYGWIQLGPANTGHAHIYTDRSNFYFNVNTMYQNGNLIWAANNDGSGSGLDADTVDGYNTSTSATANTVVVREGSGHIYGNYILGSYFNASSGNSENPTIGQIWTQNTSDNYLRKSTPAHLISQLGLFTTSNDGSGSGLDADLLDGLQASQFMRSDTQATTSGSIIIAEDWGTGTYNSAFVIQGAYPSWETRGTSAQNKGWLHHQDIGGNYTLYSIGSYSGNDWTQRFTFNHGDQTFRNGGPSGNIYYHQGNDGSGSGLDADTVDGYQGSNYLGKNGNAYYQADNWIQFGGAYGLYVPSVNGAHLLPNTTTSYGTWRTVGSRGGYDGIMFDDGGNMACMWDSSGNGGFYQQSGAGWTQYFHVGNSCTGFGTSTTSSSYEIYVSGAIYSTGNITAYSDKRVKENIVPIDNALEKVNALQGVYYNRIDDEDKTKEIGFIAQEVNEVVPELVTYAEDVDQYGVKYGNTTALLVEAVKELTQQVKDLKQEIEEIKNVK